MKLLPLLEKLDLTITPELLELAFIHRSYSYEHGGIPTNERLEFLGDSVLSVVVTEYLYETYPKKPEGQLARLRSAVVNTLALADVGRELDLGSLIQLGRGEENTGGKDKDSILADTTEAVIGAVFLSTGRDGAWKFVRHLFIDRVTQAAVLGAGLDWKSSLQEVCAGQGWEMPTYSFEVSGPEHDRRFIAHCHIGGKSFGPGEGRSKKQAEQQAAGLAYEEFGEGSED